MTEVLKAGVLSDEIDLGALAHNAAEQAEEFVRKVSCNNFTSPSHCISIFVDNERHLFDVPKQLLTDSIVFRCGRRRGKCATTVTCRNGYKTIIFYIETIGRRYHPFGRASNRCFEFTPKPEIYGPICLGVSHSLVLLRTFCRGHPLKYNYRRKLYSVPFSSVQLFV